MFCSKQSYEYAIILYIFKICFTPVRFKEKLCMSQGIQSKLRKEVPRIWLQICLIVFYNILGLHKASLTTA